jgi:hypothetical protein
MGLADIDFDAVFDVAFDKVAAKHGLTEEPPTGSSSTPKEPVMKVTPEAIRSEALSLMKANPAMNLDTASKRAEELLRIQFDEPAITTTAEWRKASDEQRRAHLDNGWDVPPSRLDLANEDWDEFVRQNPDSAAVSAITEAERWAALTDTEKDTERAAKALLAEVERAAGNAREKAKGTVLHADDVPTILSKADVPEDVRKVAKSLFEQREAERQKATDLRSDLDTLRADVLKGVDAE